MEIGQGHGTAGRYAGLPDSYGSEEFSQIVILPIPFDKTSTYQHGSNKGPEAIIEASRNMELYDIETASEPYLKGIFTDAPIHAKTSDEMLLLTYNRAKKWIQKSKFLVTLGGEHSVSYASIKAYAEHCGKLTVLHLDAHADLQQAYEGNPWSHASVMARVKEIPQVTKVVSVGIRSMSREEVPFLDSSHTFFAHELQEKWVDQILSKLEGPIYITFDLDVFDCALMPSTGTPEPGGLSWDQALNLLKRVIREKNVVGCDVVELCPNLSNVAPDYVAAKLIYKMLSYQFEVNK